jgi:haloalkane dehalogenase
MWRKLIPHLADAGFRAIAIDLIGMGRSDKPTAMQDYTILRHEKWVESALWDKLALESAHIILHDWGGIVGLRAIANHLDSVKSIIMSNTGFPVLDPDAPITKMARPGAGMLRAFQLYVRFDRNWRHWRMLSAMVKRSMPKEDVAGFAAPYPGKEYLTGNRQFTQMLPTRNDNPILTENWHALQKLKRFERPFLCLFSDKDQIAPKGHRSVRPAIPGAEAIEPIILKGGSHFLLEDIPEEYASEAVKFLTNID